MGKTYLNICQNGNAVEQKHVQFEILTPFQRDSVAILYFVNIADVMEVDTVEYKQLKINKVKKDVYCLAKQP